MDAATLDRMVTDLLLLDASDGLDATAHELEALHDSWARSGAAPASVEWLGRLITNLYWWSGRLLGGVSTIADEQGVPDIGRDAAVSS